MKGHMAAYFREQMYGEPIPPAPVVQYYVMGAVDVEAVLAAASAAESSGLWRT